MTVATFVSVKGAPGVTTLACLVAATWPAHRRVVVVEADPFGGDLASRFQLSAAQGWTSYVTACRRSESDVPFEPHLQALPGGLDVMIGARDGHHVGTERAVEALLARCAWSNDAPWDLIVDGGRLPFDDPGGATAVWLGHSEAVLVVVGRDAPSILNVRDRSRGLADRCGGRVGLVLIGGGHYLNSDIEEFTGLPVVGEVPFDIRAAQSASGDGRGARKLSRSPLVAAARRLAVTLAERTEEVDGSDQELEDGADDRPVPVSTSDGSGRLLRLFLQRHTGWGRKAKPRFETRFETSGPGVVGGLPPSQEVGQTETDEMSGTPGKRQRGEEQLRGSDPCGTQQEAVR